MVRGNKIMFYTYILESLKDGRRYIGYTKNINNRLLFHNKGLNGSTKNRRLFKLIGYRSFNTNLEAMRYEKYLKSLKGGKQLYLEMKEMKK